MATTRRRRLVGSTSTTTATTASVPRRLLFRCFFLCFIAFTTTTIINSVPKTLAFVLLRSGRATRCGHSSSLSIFFLRQSLTCHRRLIPSTTTVAAMSSSSSAPEEKAPGVPRIDGTELVGSTKWLQLKTMTWTDQDNVQRKWDMATRSTKKSPTSTDAVIIIPLLKKMYTTEEKRGGGGDDDDVFDTILVEQFRPPVRQATLEFPAGLIDKDETPEQAALRELREETGYVGEACKTPPQVSRQLNMSPGLTDETVQSVVVYVDLNNPYNQNPKSQPDDGEHIKIHRVSLKEGFKSLLDKGTSPMAIQGLYLFALGLEIGKSMTSAKPTPSSST